MTFSFEPTLDAFGYGAFEPDTPGDFEQDAATDTSAAGRLEQNALAEAREAIRAEAFEAGRAAGLATAQIRCEPALRALAEATQALVAQRTEYLVAQRQLIVELALTIARRIIGRELEAHPESIVERIAAALALTTPHQDVIVELNPCDHELAAETGEAASRPDALRLVENDRLAPGDFILTDMGTTVDARLDSLLDETRRALEGLDGLPEPGATAKGGDDA